MSIPDATTSPPIVRRHVLPPFFWAALVVSALFLVLTVVVVMRAPRESVFVRDDGWSAAPQGDRWIVARASTPPAAGATAAASRLVLGDELVAIDGDARAARLGPAWWIRRLPIGAEYEVQVRRADGEHAIRLTSRAQSDPAYRPWLWIYFAVAFAHFAVGLMVALARPEDRMVQFAYAGNIFTALFMLAVAMRPSTAIRYDGLVMALGLSFPLYLLTAYLFFERFPHPQSPSRGWRVFSRVFVASGLVHWAVRSIPAAVMMLPMPQRLEWADRGGPLVLAIQRFGLGVDMLFVVVAVVAMFAVLRRNYRLVAAEADRRRIAIVAWGQSLSLVPAVLAAAAGGVAGVAGAGPGVLNAITLTKQIANALAIAAPIAFGYAIIKQRVLGFRVFVRIGIQYILAQNALRAAALLPAAYLTYTVIANPDRTVGEILLSGTARLNLVMVAVAGLGLRYRTRIAAAIDRRFFRAAYDQEAILRRLVESVKNVDSISEIGGLASREIDAALHVSRVYVLYHNPNAGRFDLSYATQATMGDDFLAEESTLLKEAGRSGHARTVGDLLPHLTPREAKWLERMDVELVVPLTGIDQDLVGLLLLGEKRSEEPFTSKDRGLLQLVGAQIGAVYEVLMLREKVGRQDRIQTEVLARFDAQHINLVKECPACGTCYDHAVERCERDGQTLALTLPVERVIEGKYRLDRLVGHGGMGAVYEAYDLRLNRRVAVKVIKGSSFHSSSARRRFAREARACAQLDHPRIVRVHDYGAFANQSAYLVMEYVSGASWRAELDRLGAFVPAVAADLLEQVIDGMEAAHAAGILHRDLKPDNLLISATAVDGPLHVKILDFGLAKVRESSFADPKSQTMAGVTMGTFGYMSPEQFQGEDVDERSDVFSIGVIALETLTGRLSVRGPDFHQTIAAELDRRVVATARTPEHTTLARALADTLAPDRAARLRSMTDLRARLVASIRACSSMAAPIAAGRPNPVVAPAASDEATRLAADTPSTAGPAVDDATRIEPRT